MITIMVTITITVTVTVTAMVMVTVTVTVTVTVRRYSFKQHRYERQTSGMECLIFCDCDYACVTCGDWIQHLDLSCSQLESHLR